MRARLKGVHVSKRSVEQPTEFREVAVCRCRLGERGIARAADELGIADQSLWYHPALGFSSRAVSEEMLRQGHEPTRIAP